MRLIKRKKGSLFQVIDEKSKREMFATHSAEMSSFFVKEGNKILDHEPDIPLFPDLYRIVEERWQKEQRKLFGHAFRR